MNLSFPISLLSSLALLIIIAIGSYSSWNKMSAWRHPLTAAVLLLLFAIVNGIEGTWVLELQHSWAMYVIVVLLLFSLGLAICHKIQKTYSKALSLHTSKERLRLWLRKMPFLLLHTGAFLVLFGGFFGAPDKEDGQVLLEYGKPTHIAYQANGEMLPLPFDVQIDTFYIDYYADGRSPKQFTTRFTIRKIGETMDEGARMLSDEGARIKDERLNSADSETSETKVISPSSFILHPSSQESPSSCVLAPSSQQAGTPAHPGKATLTTAVNHPCSWRGYHFYQSNYDPLRGEYSVLKVVRDPWIGFVWVGIVLLTIGACWQMTKQWKAHCGWWLAVGIVTIVFTVITLAKINFGTLMPALRSAWFIPHIGVYMIAYSLLAVASVLGIVVMIQDRLRLKIKDERQNSAVDEGARTLSDDGARIKDERLNSADSENSETKVISPSSCVLHPSSKQAHHLLMGLLQTSSCLLLIGMLCGAVWAKQAWGDYWTWDPKECWAMATWMLTLIGMHLKTKSDNPKVQKTMLVLLVVFVLLSFAAMQMTWYGVNYLPSAELSLHTYGR